MKSKIHVTTDFQRSQRIQEIQAEEAAKSQARERAKKNHDFVQFQREGMKQFVGLIRRSPAAAQALVKLAREMDRKNEIAAPIQSLQDACGASRATMSRAVKLLSDEGWLRVTLIGTTRTFQVNSTVFWSAARNLKQFSNVFAAKIKPSLSMNGDQKVEHVIRAKRVPILTSTPMKPIDRKGKEAKDDA